MKNAWNKIIGVARITIADVVRQKSFIILFCLCLFLVFMVRGCWNTKMMINGQSVSGGNFAVQILQAVFVIVSGAVMLIAGLLSMRMFRRDRDEGMQAFILSKPVTRLHYLLGKIAGLWLLLSAFMAVLHCAILLIHLQHAGSVSPGYIAASVMSILNVLFVILSVSLLSLLVPDIFAFLCVFGVTAMAFIFDGIAQAARSAALKSMLQQAGQDDMTWWKFVYWFWPKSGALASAASSFIDPAAVIITGNVLFPIANIGVYCIICCVLLFVRFQREEIV
ncbi:MAG: ABC transporter permease [Spirochaetes bacterium]|nr:ABC transporter permease [Spirochaetota bacterium]